MTRGPLRWGVIGTARIATAKIIPAIQASAGSAVIAIASRDGAKARAAAASLGIPRAYDSYEALLADPDVEAVYIPLPNDQHVPWTTRAAEFGKHVLCEKPLALTAADAERLIAVRDRTGVRIQEAFMVRTHPQWIAAIGRVRDGAIGPVRAVSGVFSFFNEDPNNIRNHPSQGGGALFDIGCYLIHTARWVFGREPERVVALVSRDARFGVDRLTSSILDFGESHAVATCSTQQVPYQRVHILGTRGRIEIEIPFNAPPDRPCRLFVAGNTDPTGVAAEIVAFDTCNQYTIEVDRFATSILDQTPQPLPLEDSIANLRVMDAVWRSAASGCAERP